jgi:hypothetical protein
MKGHTWRQHTHTQICSIVTYASGMVIYFPPLFFMFPYFDVEHDEQMQIECLSLKLFMQKKSVGSLHFSKKC